MTAARLAMVGIGATFAAVAAATPLVIEHEGWVLKPYADPVGIRTACAGVTGSAALASTYSQSECEDITAGALLDHALAIRPCLPADLPTDTRGAFISFGYNIGATKFCASSLSRKARAGDLRGACAELGRWVYAGGRVYPGLVRRRAAERALCEAGLS